LNVWIGHYKDNPSEWFVVWPKNKHEAFLQIEPIVGEPDMNSFMELTAPGFVDFSPNARSRLIWSSLNPQANTLTLNTPEKNSLPRIFKISPKLVGMLQRLPKKSERIFTTRSRHLGIGFAYQRKKIAKKLGNPRLAKIHFHLIRHWKGTMEYHKTQNIIQVQRLLGHKSILNTQLYVNLEQAIFEFNDQYEVKLASTVDEAVKLVEVGFEYITEMDGKKLFRKRK
jgi:Phage integrase family